MKPTKTKTLKEMTLKELKATAKTRGVNLKGKRGKADILKILKADEKAILGGSAVTVAPKVKAKNLNFYQTENEMLKVSVEAGDRNLQKALNTLDITRKERDAHVKEVVDAGVTIAGLRADKIVMSRKLKGTQHLVTFFSILTLVAVVIILTLI